MNAVSRVILGIDPGSALLGYGLVSWDGADARLVAYGAVSLPPGSSAADRLRAIFERLTALIAEQRVDEIAVEELFFTRNVSTALRVGEARGVAMLAATLANLPVFEYTPSQVKQAVAGWGRAPKRQVQQMVRLQLGLADIPRPDDAADALAVALCHAHTRSFAAALQRAGAAP